MIPSFVRGSIAPVFTAVHEDGRLDDEGQRAILDALYETRAVGAYFVRSGMGQMYTFSYEDVRQMARTACPHMAGRGAVLVGATGIWDRDRVQRPDPAVFLNQAVELSQYAAGQGAAGVVHTVPEAIAPRGTQTPADVIKHYFETIDRAVELPIFIYQSPGTAPEYVITPELAAWLADLPRVKGMKASTADAGYIFDIAHAVADKDFTFIVGNETAFLAGLVAGARAVIGQGAVLNPAILNAVQDRFERGDSRGALEAQHSVNLLCRRSRRTTEFFKRYLCEKGYPVKPYARATGDGAYGVDGPALTPDEYEAFKRLLESELARY